MTEMTGPTPGELWELEVECPDRSRQRLVVAYHEAAHVVVGRALGLLCREAAVYHEPGRERLEDEPLGRCYQWFPSSGRPHAALEDAVRARAAHRRAGRVHCLAAPVAAWLAGRGEFPVAPTWAAFREYAATCREDEDAPRVVAMLSDEDDPAGAYADAWERAVHLVGQLWEDIGRVARQLERRGVLSGREVEELLGATGEELAEFERATRQREAQREAALREAEDRADLERWKSPGGWLWLQEHGFYDDPPDPVLLAKLEDGHYDEDLEPEEIEGWITELRERLEANPPAEDESPVGAKPPI